MASSHNRRPPVQEHPEPSHAEAAQPPTPEHAGRQLEVIHNPNTDIIINHAAKLNLWGPRLADACQDGIPAELTQPADPDYDHVTYREIGGQAFCVKERVHMSDEAELDQMRASPDFGIADLNRKELYALNSLVSEMKLAPDIGRVLADPATQQALARIGFSGGITFVDPIIGVVDRPSGRKYMVYEYIPATLELRRDHDFTWQQADAAVGVVRERLLGAGIKTGDLQTRQILSPIKRPPDGRRELYLIDAEAFTRQKTA